MGGEKWDYVDQQHQEEGSPPRGRGKGCFVALGLAADGITPAWAGKSRWLLGLPSAFEDHPRVGGEKQVLLLTGFLLLGSPPRGRGKDIGGHPFAMVRRITPAWAGKR